MTAMNCMWRAGSKPPFEFWLGDGQNAAGNLTYSLV